MPDFDQQKMAFREARAAAAQARDAAYHSARRAERSKAELERGRRAGDPARVAALEAALAERVAAKNAAHAALVKSLADQGQLLAAFEPLLDPRERIGALPDHTPILMLPLRLETRFRRAEGKWWLLVRVYPDAWAVDGFEPTLSEQEVASTTAFWAAWWAAAGEDTGRRAAWRSLVASHGAGRAAWLVQSYRPIGQGDDPSAEPPLQPPADHYLVIPVHAVPGGALAIRTYWRAAWTAPNDPAAQHAALAALEGAIGTENAAAVTSSPPVNFASDLAAEARAGMNVAVVFMQLPDPAGMELKTSSWTRPAQVEILPERLVLRLQSGEAVREAIGRAIPPTLVLGPDPSAGAELGDVPAPGAFGAPIRADGADLIFPEELKWMFDFDTAESVGMAFRVPLSDEEAAGGFDRVLVVGVCLRDDAGANAERFEQLLVHHDRSGVGVGLLPQGTPTNNTGDARSGQRAEDADEAFDRYFGEGPQLTESAATDKLDGQWFAEWLGLSTDIVARLPHAGGRDQREARAANTALWPATLGYTMESMLGEVFGSASRAWTRELFTRFVVPRGPVPAFRIGDQPYGILPATAFSRLEWPLGRLRAHDAAIGVDASVDSSSKFLAAYYEIVRRIDTDWADLVSGVAHLRQPGDAHQALLDSLGLHATSVEFYQRWSDSLDYFYNLFLLQGHGEGLAEAIHDLVQSWNVGPLLRRLGWDGDDTPTLLERIFHRDANLLSGPLVDDVALSETRPIRVYASGDRNYLTWLREAAETSLEALRKEEGFIDGPPQALLYHLLRHALQLGWWDAGLRVKRSAGVLTAEQEESARREPTFIHVKHDGPSESRYQPLYSPEPKITGVPDRLLMEHLAAIFPESPDAVQMREQLAALRHLEDAPTARLERVLAEHLDACTYRLDAWKLALNHYALARMRFSGNGEVRRGLHLGAFGWLEDVRRRDTTLQPKDLPEPLAEAFGTDAAPVMTDPENQGHLLAPSLNHAVTAAILRNGFLSNATPATPDALAVDLSSRRVRKAMALIEGVRNDQSLAALLGYQFERALHDDHQLAETDKFIFGLRSRFPLVANKLTDTEEPLAPGETIAEIEARNVIDGLALIEHAVSVGDFSYPFGLGDLEPATTEERDKIDKALHDIRDALDAVADLAVAESVHRATQGGHDAAGAALDAYGKAQMPPVPAVVAAPREGRGLTQRFLLRFDPAAATAAGWGTTPRAAASPILDGWLGQLLPAPDRIACAVETPGGTGSVTAAALGLAPLDLLALVRFDDSGLASELDARIAHRARGGLRPDLLVTLHHTRAVAGTATFFELAPLLRSVRQLLARGRALGPDDVVRRADEGGVDDQSRRTGTLDAAVVQTCRADRQALASALQVFLDATAPLIDDATALAAARPALIANAEARLSEFHALSREAAALAIPGAELSFSDAFKARFFADLRALIQTLLDDWRRRAEELDGLLVRFDATTDATPDNVRFRALQRAERLVSTTQTLPLPADAMTFRATVVAAKAAFDSKRQELTDLLAFAGVVPVTYLGAVRAVLPLTAFAAADPDLDPFEDRLVQLHVETHRKALALKSAIAAQLGAIDAALGDHDGATSAIKRLGALNRGLSAAFGEDFVAIPTFSLTAEEAAELTQVHGQRDALLRHVRDDLGRAFPLEDWLYSVARVRDAMAEWEYLTMAVEGFQPTVELELTAWQFPFLANDHWLGAEVPADHAWADGRLLVTSFGPDLVDASAPMAGLLVDEWTEVIPEPQVTTGLAFHFDQPGSEPPQVALLVTPTQFRGEWRWDDLVDAVSETLSDARKRLIEPGQIDRTAYGHLLPATTAAVTFHPITIALNLALMNGVVQATED